MMNYIRATIVALFLFSLCPTLHAQDVTITTSRANITTNGDGSTAQRLDVIEYTIVIYNNTGAPLTNARLYNRTIPGTYYNAPAVTLNGVWIPGIAFNNFLDNPAGYLINEANGGLVGIDATLTLKISFIVEATVGTFENNFTFMASQNGVNFYQTVVSEPTTIINNGNKTMYEITSALPVATGTTPRFNVLRTLNTTTGAPLATIYDGATGPCFDAITNTQLPNGSLLSNTAAIGYDVNTNRVYFVNDTPNAPLSYIDLNASPVCAKVYSDYVLSSTGRINRMAVNSKGVLYALTTDAQDLIGIRMEADGITPRINHVGSLWVSEEYYNYYAPGYDIMPETDGDIFSDGYDQMYFIGNTGRIFRIDANGLETIYLGTVTGLPTPIIIHAAGIDANGRLLITGLIGNPANTSALRTFKVDMTTMAATPLASASSTLRVGDYASANFPILAGELQARQSYFNTAGHDQIEEGDIVQVNIEISNTGTSNLPYLWLNTPIPANAQYVPNSTWLNDIQIPDKNGVMPFSDNGDIVSQSSDLVGIIKPGDAGKLYVSYQLTTTANTTTCSNSYISSRGEANGTSSTIYIYGALQDGIQQSLCFNTVAASSTIRLSGTLNEENNSVLSWSIPQKNNITSYELEYANNNNAFSKINIAENKDSLVDKINTNVGTRNYRLKIIAANGKITYSDTVHLHIKGIAQLQPNPFDNILNLQVQLAQSAPVLVRLTDINGKVVYTSAQQLNTGNNNITLTVPALTSGIYFATITTGNTIILKKKLLKI